MKSTNCRQATTADYTSLWNKIIALLGIKVTQANLQQHKEYLRGLTAYMQQWYPSTPIDEVLMAYQIGVLGQYDIDMIVSLTPVQIGKVMTAYKRFRNEELSRNPVKIEDTDRMLGSGSALKAEDQERISFAYLRYAYWVQQGGGVYEDAGNALYDFLSQRNRIPFTDERKWEFMRLAQEQLKAEQVRKTSTGYSIERQAARSLVNVLRQAIEKGQILPSEKGNVINRAKQLAFTTLINDLIQQEVSMDEFLEQPLTNQLTDNGTEQHAAAHHAGEQKQQVE